METIKSYLVVVLVAAFVAGGVAFAVKSPAPVPQPHQTYGAATGPDLPFQYLNWGGVVRWAFSQSFASGTSTVCAIQSPAATSTLKSFTARVDTSPAYAVTYALGYSATTKNSTSTNIVASYTIASSGYGAIVATTTNTALQDGIVGPNSWLAVNISTSTATGSNQATGYCEATFEQL